MADSALVGLDVAAGEKALQALAGAGIQPVVALWAKTSDYEEPRLFIAAPEFETISKLEAHGLIDAAVQPVFAWAVPNFVVLRLRDRFVSALRATFGAAANVTGMRLGGQVFGDRYIEDAYVYRIQ